MAKIQNIVMSLGLFTVLGAGCGGGVADPDNTDPTQPPTMTDVKGPDYAFDHGDSLFNIPDPFKDGNQVAPADGERMHVCGKIEVDTLGRILQTRGVNITSTTNFSAGKLFQDGKLALGQANYLARTPESDRSTTGGIVRLYDIVIAAVEELTPMANADGLFPAGTACAGAKLFNGNNCDRDGISCFIGTAVSDAQLQLCNEMVNNPLQAFGMNVLERKRLALAALAAPVYLCN